MNMANIAYVLVGLIVGIVVGQFIRLRLEIGRKAK